MREIIAIFLIVFWLAYPIGMIYLDSANFNILNTDNFSNNPDYIGYNNIDIYFGILTATFPTIPLGFKFVQWIFMALSGLSVFLLIRG